MIAFEEFAGTHGRELVRFACALTADAGLAEDVVQTVLIRLMRDWQRVATMSSPDAYARRAVVNEYLSWRRKWARLVPTGRVPDRPDPRDVAEEHATRSELAAGVAALPPRQRAAVVLRYFTGLPDAEIAAVLGCSAVTVRGYVSRALKTLRIELAEEAQHADRD